MLIYSNNANALEPEIINSLDLYMYISVPCDTGWYPLHDSCYAIEPEDMDWDDAKVCYRNQILNDSDPYKGIVRGGIKKFVH